MARPATWFLVGTAVSMCRDWGEVHARDASRTRGPASVGATTRAPQPVATRDPKAFAGGNGVRIAHGIAKCWKRCK